MKTYSENQKSKNNNSCKETASVAYTFTFNSNVIETCKSYLYLEILISNNRQFKHNISEHCKNARRSIYTLLGKSSGNVAILLVIFDKMILTICTYNCEVWGASFFFHINSHPEDFEQINILKIP